MTCKRARDVAAELRGRTETSTDLSGGRGAGEDRALFALATKGPITSQAPGEGDPIQDQQPDDPGRFDQ